MKKAKAIFLVLLGILIGAGLFLSQYLFCLNQWNHDYKAQAFASFSEYFLSVSGGAIALSVFFILLPVGILILNAIIERLRDN